jgi:hypothetical protein
MALVKWTSSASGDFSNATDWSGGAVPGSGDDAQIEVPNVTVTVSANSYTVNSLTTIYSTLSITGGSLTTLSTASIGGPLIQSGGSIDFYGSGVSLYGLTQQTGGTITLDVGALTSFGTFVENGGALSLGYDGGAFNTLSVLAGTITSSAPVLDVGGNFSQTGGVVAAKGRDLTLGGTFSQGASGTIQMGSGALELEGTGSLAGTISGTGTLLVQSGTTTLASGVVLKLPNVELNGGKLVLGSAMTISESWADYIASSLSLNGQTLTLTGSALLGGEIGGLGVVVVAGGGELDGLSLDGSAIVNVTSSVTETNNVSLGTQTGSRTQLNIESGGRLRVAGNFVTTDASANGVLTNAGTLIKTGGSLSAAIYTNVVSTGAITVNVGTLAFGGPSGSFGGTISGVGTFALVGGQNSFAKGLSLTVHHVLMDQAQGQEQLTLTNSISYGGEWSQTAGTLWLKGAGVTLTDSGQVGLDGGLITGTGTLATTATSHVNASGVDIEGTATLDVSGTVNETTSVGLGAQLGAAATLIIESGAVWNMENNSSLGGLLNNPAYTNGLIKNNGLLEKANGSATSSIVGTLMNTGTLLVGNSELILNGSGLLGGTVTGQGTLILDGSYTLAGGLALSVGRLDFSTSGSVVLDGNVSDTSTWLQDGGTVLLNGSTLTLSGLTSLEGGTVSGLGTIMADGRTVLGDGFAISQSTVIVDGSTDQIGDIIVGDYSVLSGGYPQGGQTPPSQATLQIAAGATYTLDDNVNIDSNGTLAVAGTLVALGGGGANIGPTVIDTGTISANSANLRFLGSVSGSGTLLVGAGGSLDFAGTVGPGTTIGFTTGSGSLLIEDPPAGVSTAFGATIAGFQSGDYIEFANISETIGNDTLTLNSSGTVATLMDNVGDSVSVTFATAQSLSSLSLGYGAHGDLALFHT